MCNKRGTVRFSSGNTSGITNEVFLPREILVEILTRLPAKMVGQCKCVCKQWRALMEEPSFVELHHFRANSRPDGCYLLIRSFTHEGDAVFSLTDQEGGVARHLSTHLLSGSYFSQTSVNGLICVYTMASESIFVANPITKEIISLPPFSASSRAYRHLSGYWHYSMPWVSFGFDPSTKQFKVLNIYRILKQSSTHERWEFSHCECEIFTLGSLSWRKIDIVPPASHVEFGSEGICLGGVIHWGNLNSEPSEGMEVVVTFDLKDEKFRVISLPRGLTLSCMGRLVDIGGHLAACEELPDTELEELWVLEDYDNWVWVKERIMLPLDRFAPHRMIQTKGSIQTGEILLYDVLPEEGPSLEIYYYGRNKRSLRKIDITGLPYGQVERVFNCAENLFSLQAI